MEETLDGIDDDEIEEEADAEVEKVLFELTDGKLGQAGKVGGELPVSRPCLHCGLRLSSGAGRRRRGEGSRGDGENAEGDAGSAQQLSYVGSLSKCCNITLLYGCIVLRPQGSECRQVWKVVCAIPRSPFLPSTPDPAAIVPSKHSPQSTETPASLNSNLA